MQHNSTFYDGSVYYKYFLHEAITSLSIAHWEFPNFSKTEKGILAGKVFLAKQYISYKQNLSNDDIYKFWSAHFLGRFLESIYNSIGFAHDNITVYDILPFPLVTIDFVRELIITAKSDLFDKCTKKRNDDNQVVYSIEAERKTLLRELSAIVEYMNTVLPLHKEYLTGASNKDTLQVSEQLIFQYIKFLETLKDIRNSDEKYDSRQVASRWVSPLTGHLSFKDVMDAMCNRLQSQVSSPASGEATMFTSVDFKSVEEALTKEKILFLCFSDKMSINTSVFPFGFRGLYERSNKELFFGSISYPLFFSVNAKLEDIKYISAHSRFLSQYLDTAKPYIDELNLDVRSFDIGIINEASVLRMILEKKMNHYAVTLTKIIKRALDKEIGSSITPELVFSYVSSVMQNHASILPKHKAKYYASIQNTKLKELSLELVNICMEHIASREISSTEKETNEYVYKNKQNNKTTKRMVADELQDSEIQGEVKEPREDYDDIGYSNGMEHII